MSISLKVKIGDLDLKNPVTVASGTFGYGEEYSDIIDLNKLGGVFLKGITLKPQEGNPQPRIIETPSGMINSIGLQNVGVEKLIEKLRFFNNIDTKVFVNIAGKSVEEYVELAKILDKEKRVDGLEVNVSCPNVDKGGMEFGKEPESVLDLTKKLRKCTSKCLIVKLSGNTGKIAEVAKAVEKGGADGVSLINTILAMVIDVDKRKPKLARNVGGLSGPAIRPIAVRMVWEVAKAVKIPVIGMGGIMNAQDALEFIIAGAAAISVGTGNFVDPKMSIDIIEDIEKYLTKCNIDDINKLSGNLEM